MDEVSTIAGAWLARKLPPAMEALGIRAAAEVANSIDEPYPPASSPGNPPHRRTGNLRAGVEHTEDSSGTETTISSARAQGDPRVPVYLEFGTHKMAARPYMRPVMNNGAELVAETMQRAFDGGVTPHESGD
jgi:hypothetical protein